MSKILISTDALAAKYAVLTDSPYSRLEKIREDSACFTEKELTDLRAMDPAFVFRMTPRQDPAPRNAKVATRMKPVRVAMLSGNVAAITDTLIAPPESFSVVTGDGASDYKVGLEAVKHLASLRLNSTCYQVSPDLDLSTIISLVQIGGVTRGGIFSFNETGKLTNLTLATPEAAADAIGVSLSKWIDPSRGYACQPAS